MSITIYEGTLVSVQEFSTDIDPICARIEIQREDGPEIDKVSLAEPDERIGRLLFKSFEALMGTKVYLIGEVVQGAEPSIIQVKELIRQKNEGGIRGRILEHIRATTVTTVDLPEDTGRDGFGKRMIAVVAALQNTDIETIRIKGQEFKPGENRSLTIQNFLITQEGSVSRTTDDLQVGMVVNGEWALDEKAKEQFAHEVETRAMAKDNKRFMAQTAAATSRAIKPAEANPRMQMSLSIMETLAGVRD